MKLENFSVQPVDLDGLPDQNVCIHVQAVGALQAAELALGETLVTHGKSNKMRALVWSLADDYTPVSKPLYLPD